MSYIEIEAARARARAHGGAIWLAPGTYRISRPLPLPDMQYFGTGPGVVIEPASNFTGPALFAGGSAGSKRASVIQGITVDPMDSGALAVQTFRTAMTLDRSTFRGQVLLEESSSGRAWRASFKAPEGSEYSLRMDDAKIVAVGCYFSGGPVSGIGRIGGASAGMSLNDCVIEHVGATYTVMDVRADDPSGFRASVAGGQFEGGAIRLGPWGSVYLSGMLRVIGATTAVLEGGSGVLNGSRCLASGATVVRKAGAGGVFLQQCWKESTIHNGTPSSWVVTDE